MSASSESESSDWVFGDNDGLRRELFPESGERPNHILLLPLNPNDVLSLKDVEVNRTLFDDLEASIPRRMESIYGGVLLRDVNTVKHLEKSTRLAFLLKAASGDTVFYRALACADQRVVPPHPVRSGVESTHYWVVAASDDEGKDIPAAALELLQEKVKAVADWHEFLWVKHPGKKGSPDVLILRASSWKDDDAPLGEVVTFEFPRRATPTSPKVSYQATRKQGCVFCFRPFCGGTGSRKGCTILAQVNRERTKLHPDWVEVSVTEDQEVDWRDVPRPVDSADFHALKSRVDVLEAAKDALEKRLESLETAVKAQKPAEESKASTAEATAQKRKNDDSAEAPKKKTKKSKTPKGAASKSSKGSEAGPSK